MTFTSKRSPDAGARPGARRRREVAGRSRPRPRADTLFVYAVRSTGIYCRPSCASRRPRRDRVAFFDTPARRRARGIPRVPAMPPHEEAPPSIPGSRKSAARASTCPTSTATSSLARLAARLGGSPYHLQRNFKRLVGVTPREYAEACRLREGEARTAQGAPVTGAMFDAGYGSSSRFYERAAPKLGMAPAAYRRGGAGMRIGTRSSSRRSAGCSWRRRRRGVCAVAMGSSDAELERALSREYPAATHRGATSGGLAALDERDPRPSRGPAAAARSAARRAGDGVSVAGLEGARGDSVRRDAHVRRRSPPSIGRPRPPRAVARACATNPVALAIPCHRVVPSAGGAGGYRWGAARKKALLAAEHRIRGR